MSSLIRRIEIDIMRRAKFTREKWIIERDPINGQPIARAVRRGGEITDPDDNPIGRRWPARIPARAKAPPNPKAKDLLARLSRHSYGAVPRALRRSKRSLQWLERRAEARRAKA